MASSASSSSRNNESKSDLDFTDEHAIHYNLLAENHRREGGPWPLLAQKVRDAVVDDENGGEIGASEGSSRLLVVDLASGPGEPAATIARANADLTNLRVLSTDLSGDMVRKAAAVAATIDGMLPPVVANMQDLDCLEDGSADVVTCCYGYMFPPDKPRAFRETARILRPGGTLLAATFDAVPFFSIPKRIKRELGVAPPRGDQHPMSLADPGKLEELVTQAGLEVERASSHKYDWRMGGTPDDLFRAVMFRSRSELNNLEGGWDKARGVFDRIYMDHFEEREGGGFWAKQLPEYKLLVAQKPEE